MAAVFTVVSFSYAAQELKFIAYNTLVGGLSGGIGAVINKKKGERWQKAFFHGLGFGSVGGSLMYAGKKMNSLIAQQQSIYYARLARFVFSAGNSIVENAAANRPVFSRWHYDMGFLRFEYTTNDRHLSCKLMPSSFVGILFISFHGEFDFRTTLMSGTYTFRTGRINYADRLTGSTTSNGFILTDTLTRSKSFHDIYAHEMIHTFQFQHFSGVNYFFDPFKERMSKKYPLFAKISKLVYFDLNYQAMLLNYFLIEGGYSPKRYCGNYLENEAEYLSVRRTACVPGDKH